MHVGDVQVVLIMKLDFDSDSSVPLIRSYGAGVIAVGDRTLDRPFVIVGSSIDLELLPDRPADLTADHLRRLADLGADILIIGTGSRQMFLRAELTAPLLEKGIGLESMDTAAACRCYNVLVAENRAVAAAFYMMDSEAGR